MDTVAKLNELVNCYKARIAELEAERDRLREAIQQAIDLLGQLRPSNHNKIKARRLLAHALAGREDDDDNA